MIIDKKSDDWYKNDKELEGFIHRIRSDGKTKDVLPLIFFNSSWSLAERLNNRCISRAFKDEELEFTIENDIQDWIKNSRFDPISNLQEESNTFFFEPINRYVTKIPPSDFFEKCFKVHFWHSTKNKIIQYGNDSNLACLVIDLKNNKSISEIVEQREYKNVSHVIFHMNYLGWHAPYINYEPHNENDDDEENDGFLEERRAYRRYQGWLQLFNLIKIIGDNMLSVKHITLCNAPWDKESHDLLHFDSLEKQDDLLEKIIETKKISDEYSIQLSLDYYLISLIQKKIPAYLIPHFIKEDQSLHVKIPSDLVKKTVMTYSNNNTTDFILYDFNRFYLKKKSQEKESEDEMYQWYGCYLIDKFQKSNNSEKLQVFFKNSWEVQKNFKLLFSREFDEFLIKNF